ncbi:MAG: hypothetical protein H6838_15030 [Planctomycetes bacterium]|nr:hypothetical protein [Planctomycetota bacterium]MCB9886804.1 hypothetical protein [Planctomycetota bacterium]
MNETIKAILGTLQDGRPELQVAAAQILGELRPKEGAIVQGLADCVDRSPVLGRFALDALAKIATPQALQAIAAALLDSEGLSEHAAMLLGDAGEPAHEVLVQVYPDAAPEERLRILQILARSTRKAGAESGSDVAEAPVKKARSRAAKGKKAAPKVVANPVVPIFAQALLTPETCEPVAQLVLDATQAHAPAWDEAFRVALAAQLGAVFDDAAAMPEASLARVVEVLRHLDPAGSRSLMLRLSGPEQPSLVRAAALRSLRGTKLTAAQVQNLMKMLEDAELRDLHEAIREVLSDLPEVPASLVTVLKRLLAARQPEQRLFALRLLRPVGGAEMAKVGLKYLDHDDERFRAAAAEALAHNKQAVEPLVKLMLTARDPAMQGTAAGILRRLAEHVPPRTLKSLVEKAVKLLGNNVRLGDLVLDTVLAVGAAKIVPTVVDKAVRMRRARRQPEALHLLAKVAATPHATAEARFQLAVTSLHRSQHANGVEGGPVGDATMGFFALLVRDGFPLADRLRKEASVTAEDLLRIATHFARGVGAERRFGTELLQHLATRTKGAAGDEARLALRSVGV